MEILLDFTAFWQPALAVGLCFVFAQGTKYVHDLRTHQRIIWTENGGMPSSHAALTAGLAMTVLLEQGLSLLFVVTCIMAVIVMNDALQVRRETSRHSTFLNELTKKKLFKIVGHEPLEVLVGVLIGIVIPLLVYSFF